MCIYHEKKTPVFQDQPALVDVDVDGGWVGGWVSWYDMCG